jgi:hypothetical protein
MRSASGTRIRRESSSRCVKAARLDGPAESRVDGHTRSVANGSRASRDHAAHAAVPRAARRACARREASAVLQPGHERACVACSRTCSSSTCCGRHPGRMVAPTTRQDAATAGAAPVLDRVEPRGGR